MINGQVTEIASGIFEISTFIWDAGHLFEEQSGTLICSVIFHQNGEVEPIIESDIVGRFKEMLIDYQHGLFANYIPFTSKTEQMLNRLADLRPKIIAPMHGSTYAGDGKTAIKKLMQVLKDIMT